jgi:hypothetical protein
MFHREELRHFAIFGLGDPMVLFLQGLRDAGFVHGDWPEAAGDDTQNGRGRTSAFGGAWEAEEIIPRTTKDAPGESEKIPKGKSPETPSIFEKKSCSVKF